MFTGIISDTTNIRLSKTDESGMTLTFDTPATWNDLKEGESIATNGVCLTVAAIRQKEYDCVVIPETIARTSFGKKLPKKVNLERALRLNDRLDGHLVQGHVDGVGYISTIEQSDGKRLTITFDPKNRKLVVRKGSITVDGVALTVTLISKDTFEVALIPFTLKNTTLSTLEVGDAVNLEFDIIGKYVLNSVQPYSS
jgi:riboflavin synthase